MKTGKVKRVTSNGTWEGNFGMMYKFEVEFDNGDCGEYSSKSKDQTKFVEGQETEYEFTAGKFPKVKPYYAPPQSNGQSFSYKKADNVQQSIIKQSCLKAAVDYCKGSSCSPEEVCENAQIFVDWVNGKESNNELKKQNNDIPF